MKFTLSQKRIFGIIIGIIILVGFLNIWQPQIKQFFYSLFSPVQSLFWKSGHSVFALLSSIFNASSITQENEQFKLERFLLLSQIADLKDQKRENAQLKKALELGIQNEFQLRFVEIVAKQIDNDSLIVKGGLDQGIAVGMPVITEEKVAVGKIKETWNDFARVELLSSKNSIADGKISDKQIEGIMNGQGHLQLMFSSIQQNQKFQQGDLLLTASIGAVFPKSLLVGTIDEVIQSDLNPFQKAKVKQFFDLATAEKLFVITK